MKFLNSLIIALTLCVFTVASAKADVTYVRKVESFDYLVDYSGSMLRNFSNTDSYDGSKLDAAKEVLVKINRLIPEIGYSASLHTFSPNQVISPYSAWNMMNMEEKINSMGTTEIKKSRRTGLGDGFNAYASDYSNMATDSVIVLVTDGENNMGSDPVQAAYGLLQDNPNLCLHIVSFAETEKGRRILDEIADINDCTITVSGLGLLDSDDLAEEFVEEIFYETIVEDVIVLRGVNFAFDSYELDEVAKSTLDELAYLLADNDEDSLGTDAYNQKLSMNRANAVLNYLVEKGVSASLLSAVGMGESEKFDNETEEGRYLNRRTELYFK